MQHLLLVNPKKRRAKRKGGRSAAQRAATARMLAANRARRHGGGGVRASNPRKRRAKRSYAAAAVRRTRYVNPRKRHTKRARRRNPSMRGISASVKSLFIPALKGAGGALVVDIAMGYVSPMLPDSLNTTTTQPLVKAALAVALLYAGRKIVGGATAQQMAEGSLTVILHDTLKSYVPAGITMGYLSPAQQFDGRPNMLQTINGLRGRGMGRVGRIGRMGQYVGGANPGANAMPLTLAGIGEYVRPT